MEIPDKRPFLLDGDPFPALDAAGIPDPVCLTQLADEFINAGSMAVLLPAADKACTRAVSESVRGRAPIGGRVQPCDIDIVPFDSTTFERLIEYYRAQIQIYAGSRVAFVFLDGFTGIPDLRAAILAAREYDVPVFAVMEISDECRTAVRDADVLAALVVAQSLGASAFGVTGTGGARPLIQALERLYPYATIPLIARADAGCPNPVLPHVYDLSPQSMAYEVLSLVQAGAQIVGGRNGVTPAHIRAIADKLDHSVFADTLPQKADTRGELIAANHKEIFFIPQAPEISEPLPCTLDMSEALMETAGITGIDVIAVTITGIDDAHLMAENAHMATLPILIHCDDESVLEEALVHYQGRALVDSQSFIPPEQLIEIAAHYGAIVY